MQPALVQLVWSELSEQLGGTPWHDIAQLDEQFVVRHDWKVAYSCCAVAGAALLHASTPPSVKGARAMQSTSVEQSGSFEHADAGEQHDP